MLSQYCHGEFSAGPNEEDPLATGIVVVTIPSEDLTQNLHQEIEIQNPYKEINIGAYTSNNSLDVEAASRFSYERLYLCTSSTCVKSFLSRKKYEDHRVKFHKLPRYECFVCRAPFTSYHKLVSHMEDEMHFICCNFCSAMCSSPVLSSSHFTLQHKMFVCTKCNAVLFGSIHFKKHEKHCKTGIAPVNVPCNLISDSQLLQSIRLPDQEQTLLTSTVDSIELEENEQNIFIGTEAQPSNAVNFIAYSDNTLPENTFSENTFSENTFSENTFLYSHPESTSEDECPVVFGPAADVLLQLDDEVAGNFNQPQSSVNTEDNQCVPFNAAAETLSQPLHEDVSLESVSQKSLKKFRYICKYCNSKFSSKVLLKKHDHKKHNFVCSCGEKYFRRSDLMKHRRTHKLPSQLYCSVCHHKSKTLTLLVRHEMKHRLNSLYKLKVEKDVGKCRLDCSKCGDKFSKASQVIRHEVWHEWDRIWNSYVISKAFRLKIKEEELREMEDGVKDILEQHWQKLTRNSNGNAEEEPQKCDSIGSKSQKTTKFPSLTTKAPNCVKEKKEKTLVHRAQHLVKKNCKSLQRKKMCDPKSFLNRKEKLNPKSVLNSLNQTKKIKEKVAKEKCKKTLNKVKGEEKSLQTADKKPQSTELLDSFSEDTASLTDMRWMKYWRSYIGLSDTEADPEWIAQILEGLRSKLKLFNTNNQEEIYRKMDQVALLVRVHKGKESHLNGARVVLDRLPMSSSRPLYSKGGFETLPSLFKPKVVLERLPSSFNIKKQKRPLVTPEVVLERLPSPPLHSPYLVGNVIQEQHCSESTNSISTQIIKSAHRSPRVVLSRLPSPSSRKRGHSTSILPRKILGAPWRVPAVVLNRVTMPNNSETQRNCTMKKT